MIAAPEQFEFETETGRGMFGNVVAAKLKDREFMQAESLLTAALQKYPGRISALALALPAEQVTIEGWELLYADFKDVDTRDEPITAVGVDLTAHAEPHEAEWGLEVGFYSDEAYPFSTRSLQEINLETVKIGTPWQGRFMEVSDSLTTKGLAPLYTSIVEAENHGDSTDAHVRASIHLGSWFLVLRFHQALMREIQQRGMPRALVVIGGTHDVRPYFDAAYQAPAAKQQPTEPLRDERKIASFAAFDEYTAGEIESFRLARKQGALSATGSQGDRIKAFKELSSARLASLRQHYKFGPGPEFWEMSPQEFEGFIQAYCEARNKQAGARPPYIVPFVPSPETTQVPKPSRGILAMLGFGRK